MKIRSIIVAIIAVAAIVVIGCQKDPLVDTTEITTKQVTSITGWSAVSGGEVTSDGTPTISKRGVCWSTSPEPTMNDYTVTHHNGGLGKFSVTMDGLSENTTYYVRAFAWNSTGAIYGEEYSFTTPYKPILSTLEVEEVTSVSAVCGGNITDDGNATITQRGLCWSQNENPSLEDSISVVDSVGIGTFKSEMTKLTPGTLYYVRAYATNAAGTTYGEELSFTTQNVPVLKATEFANVTQETVVCSGSILDNAGADVTEQGFCWSTTSQPTIENEKITATAENGLGDFSITLSGLQWGTTYYVRSYATNSVGTAYGDETSFTTWTLPTITTNTTTNVTDVSVDCGGTIVSDGGTDITEKGLCWNNSANPTIENEKLILNGEDFSGTITGLTDGVVYYVRAYATNAVGTVYGEERAFTTLTVPTVETYNAENVSYTTASAKAKVIADGGATVTERGFCYSTINTNPTLSDDKITVGNGTGNFNYSFTGLTDNTSYYIRSYATNSIGTAYGSTINFTTTEITAPTVAATTATNVSYTSVTLGGNVTNGNGATVTERGVCYGTSTNPTINDNKVTAENGTGTFTVSVANLADGVTFYARAYALNERGITYGEAVSFTTTKITAPTVTTTATSNVSYTTVTLGGNVTNANGATVTERGICWGTSANPIVTNSKKAVGSGTGSFTANITGLSDGTKYYVRAYATNERGTSYGEEKTFTTTKITAPTITTSAASNISYTTVTLGGTATAGNGSTIKERGICWNTSTNPTTSNSKKVVGSGTGNFTANITGLSDGTKYYVRAYVTYEKGTVYGEEKTFTTTKITAPTVTTTAASNVSYTKVTLGGNVTKENGATVTERGVCWSTSSNPTISNSKKVVGDGTGNFTANLTGLADGTTYYVRSYATNERGTAYGSEITFTTTKITVPTITTIAATSVTFTTATLGGNVTAENGASVTERGICWSTSTNPTISNSKKVVGSGTGSFTSNLTGLTDGTTYYVRAYATNERGTAYGSEITFTTTKITVPTVTTIAAMNVTFTSATLGGNVTAENGSSVTERGVCWSTSTNPTISNNKKALGSGTGSFTVNITGLSNKTKYYVRAYAINEKGISYGNEIIFTTLVKGCLPFTFSVSETKKIYFSQGNLQYKANTNMWRFAEHQYDMIGANNKNISSSYSGWIDLFGWGTSGYNSKNPYMTSTNSNDYPTTIYGTNYDWGIYNKIYNGGNQAGLWRTITFVEWEYLIYERSNASIRYGVATVNNVNGLVLLPDDWIQPSDLIFTSCGSSDYNARDYKMNNYTLSDWEKMETNGAVFLPAAGIRGSNGNIVYGSEGYYWSSTIQATGYSYDLFFNSHGVFLRGGDYHRPYGQSVRLVRDVE